MEPVYHIWSYDNLMTNPRDIAVACRAIFVHFHKPPRFRGLLGGVDAAGYICLDLKIDRR